MPLVDDLRQLAELARKRQPHIKGEEATKHSLVLPFLTVLGFDVYDPTEVQPEYIADFAKKRPGGGLEKVDYALHVGGAPAMFIETKTADATPEAHEGQLARYFNATPSVRIGIVTNGMRYRFFTDLQAPNVMDPTPFFEFDLLRFTERDVESLRAFTKAEYNPAGLQSFAEDIIYTDRLIALVNETLRNPSESFVRFLLGELDLVPGRLTAKVVERFTPIVRRAVQSTLVDMMTRSLQQEIAAAPAPPAATPAPAAPPPGPERQSIPPAPGEGTEPRPIVTTGEEVDLFDAVRAICTDSSLKFPIEYKDTATYFGMHLGKVTHWFIRAFLSGSRKSLVTRLPLERAKLLAPGYEVEAAPEGFGTSRVYISSPQDVPKLRALILSAYEDRARIAAGGTEE